MLYSIILHLLELNWIYCNVWSIFKITEFNKNKFNLRSMIKYFKHKYW